MPRRQPTMSWQELRNHLERFSWRDPRTGVRVTGFNPPKDVAEVRRKQCYVRYLTLDGRVEEGRVECHKVYLDNGKNGKGCHQRLLFWPESRQYRRVCDILFIEVDGIRVISE